MERILAVFEGKSISRSGHMVNKLPLCKKRAKAERRKGKLDLVLGFRPNPCELHATFVDEDVSSTYRLFECPRYTECLDIACLAQWQTWSCRACSIYQHYFDPLVTKVIRRVQ